MRTIRDFMKVINEGIVNEEGPGYKDHDEAIIQNGIQKINEVIDLLENEEALFSEQFGESTYRAFLAAANALGVVK